MERSGGKGVAILLGSCYHGEKGGIVMQQIKPKENPLGLKVFINGKPDLTVIPKEKAESILAALELEISGFYDKTEGAFNRS